MRSRMRENFKSGSVRGGGNETWYAPIKTRKGKPGNRLWRNLNRVAYPSTRPRIRTDDG